MATWQVQDAKARFSELLETTLKEGPQIVTRRGVEAVVLLPVAEWNRLRTAARPSLKEMLLDPRARFDSIIPPRRQWRRRKPLRFE